MPQHSSPDLCSEGSPSSLDEEEQKPDNERLDEASNSLNAFPMGQRQLASASPWATTLVRTWQHVKFAWQILAASSQDR